MKYSYFISDVHIPAKRDEAENRRLRIFLTFLEEIKESAKSIFIVGDLFDFWFEYNYVIPKAHFIVLHQLAKLQEQGIALHYLAGNHDFWLGNYLTKELGIATYQDTWTGTIEGKKFFLFHGDGVAKQDVGYRIIKRIFRSRLNIKLYRLLHPDFGIPFAHMVSGTSRNYTKKIDLRDEQDYLDFARKQFEQGYDFVLMGHRHTPLRHEENGKVYINLGDWLDNFTYARFDGSTLDLLTYQYKRDSKF
jgi:UDP-2,3-diacylglucosamine hydrolase